ncbi:hypothetical protein [Streptomyces sp. NPDC093589]|uniref:hypothetical protein n=1 Tax=Streptomyces sp. NPDC093589 TaxID=3366043 RepID=UPI0038101EDD
MHAFAIEGAPRGLSAIPTGHLLLLEQDTLGLTAGHYQAGHYQGSLDSGERSLYPVTDAEAASIREEGGRLYTATAAPGWPHPFAVAVQGMRLREVRQFLVQHPDLPDDALVVISPATHHLDGENSPAMAGIETGAYVPAMSGHGNYGNFWHSKWSDEPRPDRSIPAVQLSPSA